MPSLGSLYYTMGIRDMTDADIKKINDKLKNAGSEILLTPKLSKSVNDILPKGIKIELDPQLKTISNEALAKAVEGKVMRVEIAPLITNLRKALKDATTASPPEIEVGIQSAKLRSLVQNVLNKQGFLINITTVNDNYAKVVQQKLNGTTYKVKIHTDAREITQSVQASLMQVQSRYFGLQVSKDILRNSIDQALMVRPFNIQIAVMPDQARRAVQNALNNAWMTGKDDALAYQRLQTGELRAAQAELARLRAAQMGAADAAKAHASASISLGGAMGSNIKIAGELGSAMASLYSIHAAKEFLAQVVEIGGELEHQKIAMDTIFGDKGKTNELFGQVKGLARQSPFGVMELSKSVKALSAHGVQYNEIYDTAKRLADISAATSVDINRLILAFGKTKSRGFLDGLEAKQFAYASIPIYEMVRKKLEELEGQAVTTADVMARMKKREISFDIVKDVLWDITDPGGKFYNMQEALAGSVKTSWKLVRDNIELMFGEIAESSVGDALKNVFQILQELTRNWRTLGAVIAAGTAAFGIYKVATIALNKSIDSGTLSVYKNVMAEKQKEAQTLRAYASVTQLSAAERKRIINVNRLTAADLKLLFAEKGIGAWELKMLYARGLLSRATIKQAVAEGTLSAALAKNIAGATRWQGALIKVKAALTSMGYTLKSVGASLLGFITNPAMLAMAAISGLAYAWQKNSEQMEKAKEIGDNIFTKATEGADNLKQTLKDIKPSAGLSEHELTQGIERMEQAIKDYSPRPLQDINETLVAQDGHVLTLAERYDALKKKVEGVAEAYRMMGDLEKGDVGTMVSDAIKSTGGLLDDTVSVNAKDYSEALKKQADAIRKFSIEHPRDMQKAIDAAAKVDDAYRKAIGNMTTTTSKFRELFAMTDSGDLRYSTGFKEAALRTVYSLSDVANVEDINADRKKFESDVQDFIKDLTTNIRITWDKEIKDLNDSQKDALAIALKNMLAQAEGASEEVKMRWAKALEETFGIDLGFKVDATALIGEEFAANMDKLIGKELADKVRKGLTLTPEEKRAVHHAIYESYKSLFDRSEEDVRMALNDSMLGKEVQMRTVGLITLKVNKNSNATDWQQQILDELGDADLSPIDIKITGHSDIDSFIDEARKGYKAANEAIQELKPILVKAEINFVDGQEIKAVPLSLKGNDVALQAIDEYNQKIRAIKAIKDALKGQGIDLDVDPNKNQRTPKDKFADGLKQRFKDIKDAWSEFQKWSKTEGREAAAKRVGESGLFSTLAADKIPQTVEQYRALVKGLEDELREAGVKGTARESLLNDLLKQLLDIDKTVVDEQLKLALDKVTKEAERQLADWNLFDKIRKATGDETLAFNLAFGMNGSGETDYPAMIKQQLQKTAAAAEEALSKAVPKEGESPYEVQGYNYDKLKALYDARETDEGMKAWTDVPEEIRKAWEKANSDILKYFDQQRDAVADIIGKYQSLQEKLAKTDFDRDEEIRKVSESKDLTPEQKAQTIQRINAEADYKKFTQSNEYLQFFAGIYSLTEQEATRIGDLIEQNLNKRLQAGTISAEDYYKEIERVRQQLDKLRNVKSDAMTFLTGGVKGLNEKRAGVNDSKRLEITQSIADLESKLQKARETGDKKQEVLLMAQLQGAKQELALQDKIRDKIIKNEQQWQRVLDVANIAANIAGGLSDAFNSIKDMAAAYGADTESGSWLDIGGVLDSLNAVTGGVQQIVQSAMNGDIGGILGGVVSTFTNPFTIWAKIHDKKLDKQIELSRERSQQLQYVSDAIERRMSSFLGNAKYMSVDQAEKDRQRLEMLNGVTIKGNSPMAQFARQMNQRQRDKYAKRVQAYDEGGAYGYQRQLMTEQLAELEKQKQAEKDKKDSDSKAIAEYDAKMDELRQQILEYSQEVANSLYGIDLKGWASELGDALFDAWQKGEDGAEAFKRKAGEIIADVANNMLRLRILEPMMQDVSDYLFGTEEERKANGGKGGVFGTDFELSPDEVSGLAAKLMKGMEGVDAYNSALDQLEKVLKEKYGISMKDTSEKSGMTAGIQSVTEDTADLLASYINAIRASVAMNEGRWERLLGESLPQISVIAQSQLDCQRQIAENTLRGAVAAEAIMKSSNEISRLLSRVTQGSERFYVN